MLKDFQHISVCRMYADCFQMHAVSAQFELDLLMNFP